MLNPANLELLVYNIFSAKGTAASTANNIAKAYAAYLQTASPVPVVTSDKIKGLASAILTGLRTNSKEGVTNNIAAGLSIFWLGPPIAVPGGITVAYTGTPHVNALPYKWKLTSATRSAARILALALHNATKTVMISIGGGPPNPLV